MTFHYFFCKCPSGVDLCWTLNCTWQERVWQQVLTYINSHTLTHSQFLYQLLYRWRHFFNSDIYTQKIEPAFWENVSFHLLYVTKNYTQSHEKPVILMKMFLFIFCMSQKIIHNDMSNLKNDIAQKLMSLFFCTNGHFWWIFKFWRQFLDTFLNFRAQKMLENLFFWASKFMKIYFCAKNVVNFLWNKNLYEIWIL